MKIKDQQILNPKKLRAARFVSRLRGDLRPASDANIPIDTQKINKILVQEHQCIGDVLMLEPALTAIKEKFPDAELSLLCVPAIKELARRGQLADRVLAYPEENPERETFDLVFDFHGDVRRLKSLRSFKSSYYAGFSFSGGAKWLTHVMDYPYDEHQVDRPLQLLEKMNIPVKRKIPALKGFDMAGGMRERILLHPGANHEARKWPMEHWLELIDLLKEDKRDLIWITPPGEKAPEGIEVFKGDLCQMAELITASTLLVGCDSMSVHLSIAAGTPALAIFGSQDPELTKPYGPNGYFIIPEEECHHRRRDWRLCKECMKSVKPAEVFTKINSIISK